MIVLVFLGTILVLVGLHEFGHFLAAKAFAVYVKEYAIGMGPKLAAWRGRETLYSLRAIPIGGYVRMAGEDEPESSDEIPHHRTLPAKPPYVRALISLAGPAMNLLLAFVVICAVVWFTPLPVLQVADVVPNSPAEAALQPGDRLVAIEGRTIYLSDQVTTLIQRSAGAPISFGIQRDGEEVDVDLQPEYDETDNRYRIGAYFQAIAYTNELTNLPALSLLETAGLQDGDFIVAADGTETGSAVTLLITLAERTGTVVLKVLRDERTFSVTIDDRTALIEELAATVPFANLGVDMHRAGFSDGLWLASSEFSGYVVMMGELIQQIVSGSISAGDALTGPVGIAQTLQEGVQLGASVFFQLLAFLSLNFGLLNLVPFPALDGSRIVFALVEWIRGRPIRPEREGLIHAIGFVLLIGLMIAITYQDILRLFR